MLLVYSGAYSAQTIDCGLQEQHIFILICVHENFRINFSDFNNAYIKY